MAYKPGESAVKEALSLSYVEDRRFQHDKQLRAKEYRVRRVLMAHNLSVDFEGGQITFWNLTKGLTGIYTLYRLCILYNREQGCRERQVS